MRLAAQAKLGFYPVSEGTIRFVAESVKINDASTIRLFDPCCGQGKALAQFGTELGIPKEQLYGIELDDRRAEEAREVVGNVVHGSFFNTKIVPVQTFSLAWVNPPYDDEIKQEAESVRLSLEVAFLQYVSRFVTPHGIVILHAPEDRITEKVIQTMGQMCYDVKRVRLPPELRPYREALLIGWRRTTIERNVWSVHAPVMDVCPELVLPSGDTVRSFVKNAPTDQEITSHLEKAAFWRVFNEDKKRQKLQPVLPLGAGHLGLTLASGYLDGLLKPKNCEPHVVRGCSYKEDILAKEENSTNDEGKVTNTKTYRQNIKLKIRAVTADGTIHEIK
jgi:Uncharacterised methyltransferase family (DUF6094)